MPVQTSDVRDLDVVDGITEREFGDIVRAGRPVVIRGAIDHWPALREWTLGYLKERAGRRTVPIEFYPDGSWYGQWTTVPMRFDRYLDLLESPGEPEMCYLAQAKVDDYLPELVDDIPVPRVLDGLNGIGAGVFLGRDSITALHYHSRDEALLCQIGGHKEVTLFEPADYRHLHYANPLSYRFNFSRIDFSDAPERRYPGLREARGYRCVVQRGEALFIPLFWSHVTRNLGLSTSVTFFWPSAGDTWSPLRLALRSRFGFWFRSRVSGRIVGGVERLFGYR